MKHRIFVFILAVIIIGCEKTAPPTSNNIQISSGALYFSFDKVNAPAAVKTLTTILSRSGYTTLEKTINITTDTSASILFEQVAIGTWKVKVDAKNESGQVLYTGESAVIVLENSVSQVNLVLTPVPSGVGGVQINITWGTGSNGAWVDYDNNAVLLKSSNVYENVGVSQPRVYKVNGKYFMYYGALGNKNSVALATSYDGTYWTKYESNPIITVGNEGSWDGGSVSTGPMIMIDSIYVMYYQGYSSSTGQLNVGITTSIDGISWTKPLNNRIKVDGDYIYHASYVIQKDGKYFLYYDGFDNSTGYRAIFLASSLDGISWTKVQNQPVLKSTQQWENGGITFSTIIFENGKYTAVYADNGYNTCNFGVATSIDGVTWSKGATPIFSYQKTMNQWANAGIIYPFLAKVGDQKRIYYVGGVGSGYERRIGFAYLK